LNPFVNVRLLDELRAGLFERLLGAVDCETCDMPDCDSPYLLDAKGNVLSRGYGVVHWDRCPGNYLHEREYNGNTWRLSDIVAWLFELGEHRKTGMGAAGRVLYQEFLRLRDLPNIIERNKIALENR